MGEKTKRKVRVNGNKYYIVGEENKNTRRVSVYDDTLSNHYPNNNDIVYRKRRKSILGLGKFMFNPPTLDEMMKDAFNDAVCQLEEKQDEAEAFAERVDDRLDAVKESHES